MALQMHEIPSGWFQQQMVAWAMAGILPAEFPNSLIPLGNSSKSTPYDCPN